MKYPHLREWYCDRKHFWERVVHGVYMSIRLVDSQWYFIIRENGERKQIKAKNSLHASRIANKFIENIEP
mgnify:CR=1 FL=1